MHFTSRNAAAAPLPPKRRFGLSRAVAAMLLAGSCAGAEAQPLPPKGVDSGVPDLPRRDLADAIPGEYIVAFGNGVAGLDLYGASNSNVAAEAVRRSEEAERRIEARRDGSAVLSRYRAAIIGFSARLSAAALAEIVRIPGARIEANRTIPAPRDGVPYESDDLVRDRATVLMRPAPPPLPDHPAPIARAAPPPPPPPPSVAAPRGLDRIDQRLLPLDKTFQSRFTGKNVHVYVIDTGVFASHSEFGNRVLSQEGPGMGYNATKDGKGTGDCRDHGTGVASVIGGRTLGVATGVIIHPVRVFPCTQNSSTAVMIDGVDWVAMDRVKKMAGSPVVVNVSFKAFTSAQSSLLDQAISNSVTVGRIPYVIAAGNGTNSVPDDACKVSPALVGPAITVGNIKPENDRRMVDSNYGPCLDLFAPGVAIPAASSGGGKGNRDGTSFAAPHVTGVAALFLEKNPAAQPLAIRAAILAAANIRPGTAKWCGIPNRMTGSPDVLLHWGSGSDNGIDDAARKGPVPPPPSC